MDDPSPRGLPSSIQNLQHSEILDQIPVSIACFDLQFRLKWFNRNCEKAIINIAHLNPAAVIGNCILDYLPEHKAQLETVCSQVIQTGKMVTIPNFEAVIDSGRDRQLSYLQITIAPVLNKDGQVDEILLMGQDVSPIRQSDRDLEESRRRMQAIFDNSMDAILLIDNQAMLVDANPAACVLLQNNRDSLIGTSFWDAAPNGHHIGWWRKFQERGSDQGIFQLRSLTNSPRTVEFRAAANIAPGVHLAVLRDITEKQQAEERLRATQELLTGILDNAPMPIYVTGLDGNYQITNHAWEQYFRSYHPGLNNRDLEGIIPAEKLQQFKSISQAVVEANAPVEIEDWLDKPEGRYYFHTVKFPLRDETGQVDAICGISIDITDRRKAEIEVHDSEKKFRGVVEKSADGIVLADEKGFVIEWNNALEEITGLHPDQVLSKTLWDVQFQCATPDSRTPANYQRLKCMFQDMMNTGKSPWLEGLWESQLQHVDGTRKQIQSRGFLIESEHGWMIGSIIRDVTRQRQVQEEIKQRNRELSSLLAISKHLNGQLSMEGLLKSAVLAIVDTLPQADSATIWVKDVDCDVLRAYACDGKETHTIYEISSSLNGSLAGKVFQDGKPIYIRAYRPRSGIMPSNPIMDRIRSMVGIPLLVEGRGVGVLFAASNTKDDAFNDNDERWLQSLAGQVAVMVENARLFEEVNSGRERQEALSRQLVQVQEAERRRIARELHDEVGQILTGLKLLLKMTALANGEEARKNLVEAQELTNLLLSRVHDISLDLRPAMLDDLGLLPALLWQVDRFTTQTGVSVHFRQQGLEGKRFPPEVETVAYRIVQEALTNVARHADVKEVSVRLCADEDELGLRIEDQGTGFNPAEQMGNCEKAGLNGMRERALLVGGSFFIQSRLGEGTLLQSVLPLAQGQGGCKP